MVRFQLILTRLPAVPAHELAARLHNMPPELNRGILTNAMWRGQLPDVAIGWSEHEAPMRAALARIVELGGEGYVESQPTGIDRLIAMFRAWRAGRRVQPGAKQRKPGPAGPTPAELAGEPRYADIGRAWLEALEGLAEASATFAVLFVVSALLYLGPTDPRMIADPLPYIASRRAELLALLVGLLAAQACVYGLRRSFAGGRGVWRARFLVAILASSAVLAATQIAPASDRARAGRGSRGADMRTARASRGSTSPSTLPTSGLDAAALANPGALAEGPDAALAENGPTSPDAGATGAAAEALAANSPTPPDAGVAGAGAEAPVAPATATSAESARRGAPTRTTTPAAATTRAHAPISELDILALFAKVVSQMAGPAPDPLRRVGRRH